MARRTPSAKSQNELAGWGSENDGSVLRESGPSSNEFAASIRFCSPGFHKVLGLFKSSWEKPASQEERIQGTDAHCCGFPIFEKLKGIFQFLELYKHRESPLLGNI